MSLLERAVLLLTALGAVGPAASSQAAAADPSGGGTQRFSEVTDSASPGTALCGLGATPASKGVVRSVLECANRCAGLTAQGYNCSAFNYWGNNMTCQLFERRFCAGTKLTHCSLYQMPPPPPVGNATDCYDVSQQDPAAPSGVYEVWVGGVVVSVFCDMTTRNQPPGWTVFQRRQDGSMNFNKAWTMFRDGFGNLSNEFWLGNDNLAALTANRQYMLRVEVLLVNSTPSALPVWVDYTNFVVGGAASEYQLASVGSYNLFTSNAVGDALSPHVGAPFSTYDVNNYNGGPNCSISFLGAWWYKDCVNIQNISCGAWSFAGCQYANLNGKWKGSYGTGAVWNTWSGNSLAYTQMKLRPMYC